MPQSRGCESSALLLQEPAVCLQEGPSLLLPNTFISNTDSLLGHSKTLQFFDLAEWVKSNFILNPAFANQLHLWLYLSH